MSSKYKLYLVTTCLPVMSLSLATAIPAQAGFEWTPPAKASHTIAAPVAPTPMPMENAAIQEVIVEEVPTAEEQAVLDQKSAEEAVKDVEVATQAPTEMKIEEPTPTPKDSIDEEAVAPEVLEEKEMAQPAVEDEKIIAENVAEESDIIEIPATPPAQETASSEELLKKEIVTPIKQPKKAAEKPEIIIDEQPAPSQAEILLTEKATPEEKALPVPEDKEAAKNVKLDLFPVAAEEEKTSSVIALNEDGQVIKTDALADEAPKEKKIAAAEEINWNTPETPVIVEGFGSDMPLVLALGQIVPAKYAYSFDKSVNPAEKISWDGGKPWNEVLMAALEAKDLEFAVKGKTLQIKKKLNIKPKSQVIEPASKPASEPMNAAEKAAKDIEAPDVIVNIPSEEEPELLTLDEAPQPEENLVHITETPAQNEAAKKIGIIHPKTSDAKPSESKIISFTDTEETSAASEALLEEEISEIDNASAINDLKQAATDQSEITKEEISWVNIADPKADEVATPIAEKLMPESTEVEIAKAEASEDKAMPENPIVEESSDETITAAEPETVTPEMPAEPTSSYRIESSKKITVWQEKKQSSLKDVLQRWCDKENIELVWDAQGDYTLAKDVFISGTFENAVPILMLKGIEDAPQYEIKTAPHYRLVISD